jgi:1-hydroxycarotenoid 3,4-desaturase
MQGVPRTPRVTVIGAGAGGLAAAIDLARAGVDVTLLERADAPGGKISQMTVGPARIDAGPTVFTMRWVFESLFHDAGTALDQHIQLQPVETLARHAWGPGVTLDLFADIGRSADAIGRFAGPAEAAGYRAFCARAQKVYRTLQDPFIRAQRPTALSLAAGAGLNGLSNLLGISPFATLWDALGKHFHDPRLRQLFGRYATYSGSSPFAAPATLMLIAHVEQQGVWLVAGGMARLAASLAELAINQGAVLRYAAEVSEIIVERNRATGVRLTSGERIEADAVVCNADCAALTTGVFGAAAVRAVAADKSAVRSLSAVTWALAARTEGFALARHNVFFAPDYAAEFAAIFQRQTLPRTPTVYVCAQDRAEPDGLVLDAPERLLVLINAPAIGDRHRFTQTEIASCETATFALLQRCGLTIHRQTAAEMVTTPNDFGSRFPATGGALYGRAVHGAMAAFRRPASRSAIKRLYLAGGSVHPGPGVPMAVISGRLAAASVLQDLAAQAQVLT